MEPLISICITCYNASNTIEGALDSALSQDWKNFEIVVVDDTSTDGSQEILKKKSIQYPCIRLIINPRNYGCAKSRNILVEAAKGEFIVFFDDDDVSRSDRVRLQYNKIVNIEHKISTQLICCYTSGKKIYPNGYIKKYYAVGTKGLTPTGQQMVDYLLFNKRLDGFFYGSGTPTCSLMLRKIVFEKIGLFDESFERQEDADFAIRFGLKGGAFTGIVEPVLEQHATNDSNKKSAKIEFKSTLKIFEKNKNYLISKNSYYYMCMWTEMRYQHFVNQDKKALLILLKLIRSYPLRTIRHFFSSAIKRFIHEKRMSFNK
jgi:glycosyltransferase involved in cell wall biosynthesis